MIRIHQAGSPELLFDEYKIPLHPFVSHKKSLCLNHLAHFPDDLPFVRTISHSGNEMHQFAEPLHQETPPVLYTCMQYYPSP